MPDLTIAVEIAAKNLHARTIEYLTTDPDEYLTKTEWDNLPQSEVRQYKEAVIPIVTALAEAGLLKDS